MPTQILSISLASSGPGPSVDVSAMVGPKTVQLTGTFRGAYVVYGSHDGTHFAPLFQFDAGGVEGFRRTFSGALASVLIVSLASGASGVTASISGVVTGLGGDNHFAVLSVLAPGARGPQPALDLGLVNFASDLNFIAQGGLSGDVVVEGSLDGVRWNPVGEFSVGSVGSSLLAPAPVEFGPLGTDYVVRYVRVNVLGDVTSTMTVTVGGSKDCGGAGLPETLAQAYLVGSSAADQTLVLSDVHGGRVVFDASGSGFTDYTVLQVLGLGAADAFELFKDGSVVMGLSGIVIGEPGFQAGAPAPGCVAIGRSATVVPGGNDPRSIAIGPGALTVGQDSISVGNGPSALADSTVAVGRAAICSVYGPHSVVVGDGTLSNGPSSVVIGDGARCPVLGAADGVVVGRGAFVLGVGDVAIGAGVSSIDTLSAGGTVVVGSGAQGDSRSVVLGVGAKGGTDAVVAGSSASAVNSPNSVVLGSGAAATSGSNYSVVVGPGAAVEGLQSVAVGYGATTGVGLNNVVLGPLSVVGGVGGANTLVGFACYVGDPLGETRDFHNNVRVGSGNVMYANYSVVLGNNCVVGDTSDASIIEDCVAVGPWSTVTGSYGMAFGLNATAAAYEVVFGDGVFNEGYVEKFHVVSDVAASVSGAFSAAADSVFSPGVATTLTAVGTLPVGLLGRQTVTIFGSAHYDGTWYVSHVDRVANKFDISTVFVADDTGNWSNVEYADLFSFDKSQLTGPNTTVMTLVIKQSNGTTVLNVPVTLSAPVLGVSNLQVANS